MPGTERAEESPQVEAPVGHADDSGEGGSENQDGHDVESAECEGQYADIRQHGEKRSPAGAADRAVRVDCRTQEQVEQHGCGRRRNRDFQIRLEFPVHFDALGSGRRDGGVGDHREVVSEHCAADDRAEAEAGRDGEGFGEPRPDRAERGDRADRRADRERDEAGHDEKPGQQQVRRDDRKRELDGRIDRPHRPCGRGKGSGQNENEAHGHDVRIPHAVRKEFDLAFERRPVVQQQRRRRGDQKRDRHPEPCRNRSTRSRVRDRK